MTDLRQPRRAVPAWIIPWLLVALFVQAGATGGNEGEGAGGGGSDLVGLGLLLGGVVVGAVVMLIVGYVVLRWRAGPAPAEVPGDWWTCRSCGAANIAGSPRCHACGAWPR